jgi:hypothetical protein
MSVTLVRAGRFTRRNREMTVSQSAVAAALCRRTPYRPRALCGVRGQSEAVTAATPLWVTAGTLIYHLAIAPRFTRLRRLF